MTQQMQEALEKRHRVWGEQNVSVWRELKHEVRYPLSSWEWWMRTRGMQAAGGGYIVRIQEAP